MDYSRVTCSNVTVHHVVANVALNSLKKQLQCPMGMVLTRINISAMNYNFYNSVAISQLKYVVNERYQLYKLNTVLYDKLKHRFDVVWSEREF